MAEPNNPLENLRIVVVEDDHDTREMVRFILRQNGAAVTAVGSFAEAMEAYRTVVPDIVVADIGMPDYNGYALIAKIRSEDAELGRNTPALALTAFTSPADRDTALTSGFQEYLSKPFDPNELITTIVNLVGRKAA